MRIAIATGLCATIHAVTDELTITEQIQALIPSGLREDLARAMALWLAGHSTHEASRMTGVSQTTVWENVRKLPQSVKDGRAKYADAIEDILFPVVKEAYAQIGERIATEKLKAGELNFIAGTAVDKIIGLRRLKQGADGGNKSPLDSLLTKLAESGGTATLTVEPNTFVDAKVIGDDE
jgi:hypothetical protein